MGKIACTHPGKLGDAIYSLPVIKKLCELRFTTADFYTSQYCKPLKRLFEFQPYIDHVYIPDDYKIERMDIGVQPWQMPVDSSKYDVVYQMGFRTVPDRPLPEFIAKSIGLGEIDPLEFKYPDIETMNLPYIVLGPRGSTSYKDLFIRFVKDCPIPVVTIGGTLDYIGIGIDKTGIDLLETTTWIAKSVGFVGIMSSQLVLANGFNIPKIAVHDGIHWDMRHVIRSESNFYPINPDSEYILTILGLRNGTF